MARGSVYGVGVGPGDPELLTLKAVRILCAADVLAVPGARAAEALAYRVACAAVPELATKEVVALSAPMVRDRAQVGEDWRRNAQTLAPYLDAGRDVAFLTLGDPALYSTFGYLRRALAKQGYATQQVCGVPSFCAAAARLGVSLAEGDAALHVEPADRADEAAEKGTRVFLKAGGRLAEVGKWAAATGRSVVAVERCGMEGERVYEGESLPKQTGYLTLAIVREAPSDDSD